MKDVMGTICHVLLCAVILAIVILLGGCDSASASDEPVGTQDEPVVEEVKLALQPFSQVIIIGDSIMSVSFDADKGPNYAGTAAHILAGMEYKVANISRGGGTIKEFYENQGWGAVNYLLRGSTAIVIELGFNDSSGWSTLEEFNEMYRAIIANIEVKSEHQETFCYVPLAAAVQWDYNPDIPRDLYRDAVREIAAEGHCTLMETKDWISYSMVNDGYHLPDGLHPGDVVHAIIAEGIHNALTANRNGE